MKWVAMFSQTGSEIVTISRALGRAPDMIITNNKTSEFRHPELNTLGAFIMIDSHSNICDYLLELETPRLITLHGYMRILPADVVEKHEIINGHPGDIIKYPELKGKDPQSKAIDLQLKSTGVVLHKVNAEVDEGEILSHRTYGIPQFMPYGADELINDLKVMQSQMWVELLKERFDV